MPRVTVITIVLNAGNEFEKTIRSVAAQTYPHIEYIVVDGGSTDGTLECIERYEDRIDYWISEPDAGISDAFNKGLGLASGEWIVLLNAGDCFMRKDSLDVYSGEFKTPFRIITAFAGTSCGTMPDTVLENSHDLRRKSMIAHQATLVHRDVYKAVGEYNRSYRIRMDYEFWMRALKRYEFKFIDDVLIDYAPNGISARNDYLFYLEEHRANMSQCENTIQFLGAMMRYAKMKLEACQRKGRSWLERQAKRKESRG
jgi:glycosyltransferase involved in cell wall biosynthesis